MITTKQFEKAFIGRYKILEEEFASTFKYVSFEKENKDTYSDYYLNLLLSIGSEIDIIAHYLAKLYSKKIPVKSGWNTVYKVIEDNHPNIKSLKVIIEASNLTLTPWNSGIGWNTDWWTVYNEVKHNRTGKVRNSFAKDNVYGFKVGRE